MLRRIVCILSAVGLAVVLGIPVFAAASGGSIHVMPGLPECQKLYGRITLCRIGVLTADSCRITDGLADWVVSRQETGTEDFLQWALQQSWKQQWVQSISENQGAAFENLEEGLYLVRQTEKKTGYSAFAPFLVALPAEKNMVITIPADTGALSEIPKTGDYPAPIFLAMMLSFGIVLFMIITENKRK